MLFDDFFIQNFGKIKTSKNMKGLCRSNTVDEVTQLNLTAVVGEGFVKMCVVWRHNNEIRTFTIYQF